MDNKYFEKAGLYYWSRKQSLINKNSKKFKEILRENFFRQKNQVLKSVKAISDIDFNLKEEILKMTKQLSPEIINLLKINYINALEELGVTNIISTPKLEQYITDYGLKFITTVNKYTQQQIDEIYSQGKKDGLNLTEIKDNIRQFFEYTIFNRTNEITDTELNRIANWGTNEAYKDSGVVSKKVWWTAQDERVCDYCGPLNGGSWSK